MADSLDAENTADLIEEDPPPILSSLIREVFPIFASMLDIKSFKNFSMTCKDIYERCMNDKRIRINLEEMEVSVNKVDNTPIFFFHSFDVTDDHVENYLAKLRQLKYNVYLSMKRIHFQGPETDVVTITETRRYLKEIGVKNIETLKIDGGFTGWQEMSFIKDFNVKEVEILNGLPDDALRSLLQFNLDSFTYHGQMEGEILLQVQSPIPLLKLTALRSSAGVFSEILEKIQKGALKKLIVSFDNVPWNDFKSVSSRYDGRLRDERPLIIDSNSRKRWFLHWDGSVTKCVERHQMYRPSALFKCEPNDYPAVLNSRETVHKALAEKRDIESKLVHFYSFFDGCVVVDSSHKGSLPEARPLLFKYHNDYYLLNEDGSMDVYRRNCELTEYKGNFDLKEKWPDVQNHLPLQKFIVTKMIEEYPNCNDFFNCRHINEFRSIFKDLEILPLEFEGQLPDRRPLVFKNTRKFPAERYVFLKEDGSLVLCEYLEEKHGVHIYPCPTWDRPSILIEPDHLQDILLNAPLSYLGRFKYSIDISFLRGVLKEIKTLSFDAVGDLPNDRPLVFKKTKFDEEGDCEIYLLLHENWEVRMYGYSVVDDRPSLSYGYPWLFPSLLKKPIVKAIFEGKTEIHRCGFYVNLNSLNECLEDLKALPFDYSDRLPKDRPLIFMKRDFEEQPEEGEAYFWILSETEEVSFLRWKRGCLEFEIFELMQSFPPALKTKEALNDLLQLKCKQNLYWYGSSENFLYYFESHMMFDFDYDGPLPRIRPLVFKQ